MEKVKNIDNRCTGSRANFVLIHGLEKLEASESKPAYYGLEIRMKIIRYWRCSKNDVFCVTSQAAIHISGDDALHHTNILM